MINDNSERCDKMDNYIIRMILDDFEKNFNISVQIVYDSRKNIMRSNPKFKIGNSAAGFQDTNSKTIYLFSDVIEKIRNKNYYNKSDENDNGLTYLILASFHELEHYIQRVHPEKLRVEKLDYPKAMFDMEDLIIKASMFLPDTTKFDYHIFHDNLLLEIDADKKGTKNARSFARYHKVPKVNQRYLDLMDEYNEFRTNNYDIPIFVNEFIKIINQYPDMLRNRHWLDCDELIQFFNPYGTLKPINELMTIDSKLLPYFVSSINCMKSINELPINHEQISFVDKCLCFVIDEHNKKQKKLREISLSHIEATVNELKRYTQVNGENSKTIRYMSNENYYNYLHQVHQYFKTSEKGSQEKGGYSR